MKNADLTFNDYSQKPKVTENKYDAAAYNRLVKVADGQDDHDVVVMEQLKQYANKDALNLGNNIKVYKTDEKGNVQLDKDKNLSRIQTPRQRLRRTAKTPGARLLAQAR